MTIAHDATTRFPATAGATDNTAGARTFTHTPVGTPKAVVLLLSANALTTALATSVTYGSATLTLRASAIDTSESGRVEIWAATSGIPTGAQTVTINGAPANSKVATCHTLTTTASGLTVLTTASTDTTTSVDPSQALTLSATALSYGVFHTGLQTMPATPNTGSTHIADADYGNTATMHTRRTSPDAAGTATMSYSSAAVSDDWCAAAIALSEPATSISAARLGLASITTPAERTDHTLYVRAKVGNAAHIATLRATLYETTTAVSGVKETPALSTSFVDYALGLSDTEAAAISNYGALAVDLQGWSASGNAAVISVAEVWLAAPASTAATPVSGSDSAAVTDLSALAQASGVSDSTTATDSVASLARSSSVTDSGAVTDIAALARASDVFDSIVVTDLYVALAAALARTETITLTDIAQVSTFAFLNVSDTITIVDTSSVALGFIQALASTVTDNVSVTETEASTQDAQPDESITLSDASTLAASTLLNDTVAITDARTLTVAVSASDAITVADQIGISISALVTELVTWVVEAASTAGSTQTGSDSIVVTDTVIAKDAGVNDVFLATEVRDLLQAYGVVDALGFSEQALVDQLSQPNVDSFGVSDNATIVVQLVATETINVSDAPGFITNSRLVTDSVTIADSSSSTASVAASDLTAFLESIFLLAGGSGSANPVDLISYTETSSISAAYDASDALGVGDLATLVASPVRTDTALLDEASFLDTRLSGIADAAEVTEGSSLEVIFEVGDVVGVTDEFFRLTTRGGGDKQRGTPHIGGIRRPSIGRVSEAPPPPPPLPN